LRLGHNLPEYFFNCTNVTKKGLMLMSVAKKIAKAQGSEIKIGFKERS